jgi:hypothetical protein
MTVLQTIGMRVNPTVKKDPTVVEFEMADGSFNGKDNKVWCFEFEIEYEEATDIETLQNDFNLVPFISGLNETKKHKEPVFITSGKDRNIIFVLDK